MTSLTTESGFERVRLFEARALQLVARAGGLLMELDGEGGWSVEEDVVAGVIAVKSGTLDDRSEVTPTVEAWCEHKQPWVELPGMVASLARELPSDLI